MKKVIITFVLVFAAVYAKAVVDPIRHTDSTSLVAIYNNAGGAGWINKSGWLTANLEGWHGITVSNNRVTVINLPENNLVGNIPLGSLTALTYISVRKNPNVTISDYSAYGSLQVVDLNETNCGMPANIGALVNLRNLQLWSNGISQVGSGGSDLPAGLANLTNLEVLSLGGNHFTGTLAPISNLTKLTWLDLNDNEITGTIPSSIGNMTQLTAIYLTNNNLTGTIPPSLGSLSNLNVLWLGANQLTGTIPAALGNLTNLKSLMLGNNQLTGAIPTEIGNLINLEQLLWLGANQLTGPIPPGIVNMTSLKDLRLDNNMLTGTIPAGIGNLTLLTNLFLNSNDLTGPIPASMGSLSSAQEIWINDNKLTGSIPVELGNLTQIKKLDIGLNQLTGTVPVQLNNLVNLVHFSLCTNQLTGTLPANFLTNSDLLETLYICNNNFTGAVPIATLSSPALNYAALFGGGYSDIPDIHLLPVFSKPNGKVEVGWNWLTFEDIEPNRNIAPAKFTYVPQYEWTAAPISVAGLQPLNLQFNVPGSANQYQWQLNGVNIPGANSHIYDDPSMSVDDYGTYTLVTTNTLVPSLTIKRHVAINGGGAQSITFNTIPVQTYANAPLKAGATASSGLAVTYTSSNTAVASIRGDVITIEGAGTSTITAHQAGDASFGPAVAVSQTLTVNKASQTITTGGQVGSTRLSFESYDPRATASSGLPVSYSSFNQSVAKTFQAGVPLITTQNPGSVAITVSQAGNDNYNPAPNVLVGLTVIEDKSPYTFIGQAAGPVAQFSGISGLAVGGDGKIYIPNANSNQVIILNADGTFHKVIGPDVLGLGVLGGTGTLGGPTDIALDATGKIYVAERTLHRVSVFNPDGTLVRIVGSRGSASGQLSSPGGIDVDANGKVYVMESGNNRVSIFNADGTFDRSFGSGGSANGEFSVARGIDVNSSGIIVVSDQGNSRIQVFANNGTYLFSFGSAGEGDGQFSLNKHIQLDATNNLYVADDGNNRIQKFNSSGGFVSSFTWANETYGVSGLALDAAGNIYASYYGTSEIIKFSQAGTILQAFTPIPTTGTQVYAPRGIALGSNGGYISMGTHEIKHYDTNGAYVRTIGSRGSGDGQLLSPSGIAVDGDLNVYVADQGNDRVQVFDATGAFVRKFGMGTLSSPYALTLGPDGVYVTDIENDAVYIFSLTGTLLSSFGGLGTAHGQFDNPEGIDVDSDGNIYVADFVNQRIEIFNSNHVYQRSVGEQGFDAGQFMGPTDVALDNTGRIYVLDWYHHHLQVFENNGTYLFTMGSRGTGTANFNNPSKIAIVNNGSTILITDRGNNANKVYGFSTAQVKVNGSVIASEETHDFGDVNLQVNKSVTFTIESIGNGPVHFTGVPKAFITGTNASDFTVNFSSLVSIWPGSSTTVSVTFDPSAEGVRTAQLHIPNTGMEGLFNLTATAVTKLPQSLIFSPITPYVVGDPAFVLPPVSSAGLPVIYTSSNTSVVTVSGNELSFVGPGTSQITASQPGDGSYSAAIELTRTMTVTERSPAAYTYRTEWGGSADRYLYRPNGLDVDDATGLTYVADEFSAQIMVLNSANELVRIIGASGAEFGKFGILHDVKVKGGKLFVVDGNRVQILLTDGTFIRSFGTEGTNKGEFTNIRGIDVDDDGIIYVADGHNHRVQVFEGDGTFLRTFGSYGTGDGQFNTPNDVLVDAQGHIYVTDIGNCRVQVFENNGSFIRSFGSFGNGDGQFGKGQFLQNGWAAGPMGPYRIALDAAGNCYATDAIHGKVQKFNSAGVFQSSFGSQGPSAGQLWTPLGIDIDGGGNFTVSEFGNTRMQRFSSAGAHQSMFTSILNPNEQVKNVNSVSVDVSGNVYASDGTGTKLFDRKGQFVRSVSNGAVLGTDKDDNVYTVENGSGSSSIGVYNAAGTLLSNFAPFNWSNPQFFNPTVVVVGPGDVRYVLGIEYDIPNGIYNNMRVYEYDATGAFIKSFGHANGEAPFKATSLAVDADGDIYLSTGQAVAVYDSDGNFLRKFGSIGQGPGQVISLNGIVLNSLGQIFVADTGNRRIQVFENDGTFLFGQGSRGDSPGQFTAPLSIALDPTGTNLYVVDNSRVKAFGIPEINVKAVSSSIASGELKDFGNVNMLAGTAITFDVENIGSAPVVFSGSPKVSVSGPHASDFFVSGSAMTSTVEDGESTFFGVTFTPSQSGLREAQLTIASNDANEAEYIINLQGTGVKVNQTITFTALTAKTYGDPDFALGATTTSGLPITYTSSDVTVATVTGNMVTVIAPGTTTITASQAGDVNYNAASNVTQILTVNKASQTITFAALASKTFGDAAYTIAATSTSGLQPSFTSDNSAVATVSGNTVTIIAAGTANITASEPGNANYLAATPVVQSLTVAKAPQTITFGALSCKTFGNAPFVVTATSTSGLQPTFASDNTAVATVAGNTVTIVGAGTANITASQSGSANYLAAGPVTQSLTVAKASQTITFAAITAKTFGDAAFVLTPTSTSGLQPSLASDNIAVATVSGNTVTIVGAGSANIIASQAGDADYLAATPVSRSLTVAKASQTITFAAIADKSIGAVFSPPASASSTLAVVLSTTSDKASVAGGQITTIKAGRIVIKADQTGNTNFNAAPTEEQSFCINPNKPTIDVNNSNPEAPVLTSSSATGNQWFLNDVAIAGQTNQTHTVTAEGTFKVQVKEDDCLSEMSDGEILVVTGLQSSREEMFLVYPNPVSDQLVIRWSSQEVGDREITVYDMLGRRMESRKISADETVVDVASYSAGSYQVVGTQGEARQQLRFVKK